MDDPPALRVDGAVEHPASFRYEDLDAFPPAEKVADVSRFQPGRHGDGVTLDALLARVAPRPEADYLTLHADRDDFHVSIPLAAVRAQAVVVYQRDGRPLTAGQGGPIRFLIKDQAACATTEIGECANVKYLSRIELSVRRGRDTRPADDAAHAALHAAQKSPGV